MAAWSLWGAQKGRALQGSFPITVALSENEIIVSHPNDEAPVSSPHGLARTLIYLIIGGIYYVMKKSWKLLVPVAVAARG